MQKKRVMLACVLMSLTSLMEASIDCVTIESGSNLWRFVANVGTCLNSFTPIVLSQLSAIESIVDDINENLLSVSDVLGSQIMQVDTALLSASDMIISDIETIIVSEIAMIASTLDDIHEDLYSESDILQSQIMQVDTDLLSVSDVLTSQLDVVGQADACVFGTIITQADLPLTINSSGLYTLCGDIGFSSAGTPAITIASPDVTLDFNSYTLSFVASSVAFSAIEVSSGYNVIIRNGILSLIGLSSGIAIDQFGSGNVLISNMIIQSDSVAGSLGISVTNAESFVIENCQINQAGTGIVLSGCSEYIIRDCVITEPANIGISITSGGESSDGCEISKCAVFKAASYAFDISISPNSFTLVKECSAFSSTYGFHIGAGNGIILEDCVAFESSQDGFLLEGNQMTLTRCVATNNAGSGFNSNDALSGLVISNCVANSNGATGFVSTHNNALLEGCVAVNNGNNGFVAQNTVSLRECSATANTGIGFDLTVTPGIVIKDCLATQNTSSGISDNGHAQVILDTRSYQNGAADVVGASTVVTY